MFKLFVIASLCSVLAAAEYGKFGFSFNLNLLFYAVLFLESKLKF